jgi:O-antigen biosynthesis protein
MGHPDQPDPSDDAGLVTGLQTRLEALEQEVARGREAVREAAATNRAQAAELRRLNKEVGALRARRSVRLALATSDGVRSVTTAARKVARRVRGVVRAVRRRIRERLGQRGKRASPASEAALAAALRERLAPATVVRGPLVSIVILNRDGREHLERCLREVAGTAYRDVEVIVVDNGSTDGSAEVAEHFIAPFPIRVIRNAENRSFSEANGQGVAIATGDLICFLNNDVDPITEHWLGYLVETLTETGAAAVGARLIYPRHRGGRRAGGRFADLTIQHAGVAFDRAEPIPLARVIGAGEDPLAPGTEAVRDRPALTAACLLVSRQAFDAVGGFAAEYDYGIEDVDLCLKLRAAGGRLVYDGRATLWHHESATRAAQRQAYRARVKRNREVYVDRWGPRIFRDALLDALAGGGRFSSDAFHVAITVTSHDPDAGFGDWYTGHELGEALETLGWRVTYLERADDGWYGPDASVEAVIVLLDACDIRRLPRNLVTMAWVRNWPERWLGRPWFDEYDLVFGSSRRIVDMVHERSAKVASLLPIATNPDRFASAEASPDLACDVLFMGSYWGEYRDIVDALPALAARGFSVHVHGRGWGAVPGFAGLDRGFISYEDVPRAYASARIVVDDAASSTKAYGSVNSRVFDALAMGAIVVSNGSLGVHDLFDASFPTWSDASSLVDLVGSILGEPERSAERTGTYRATVLAEHTYPLRARSIRDALEAWASATRYGLRIGVPSWEASERWGDYHFARALQRSLERAGHPTRLHFLPDWHAAVAGREDVAVHLFGLKEAPTRRAQVNILWQISHPDLATPEMYDRYDHVFVASDLFAARMASLARVPVSALHQATDPERFKPDPTGPRHELLFVANSRKVQRRIVEDLVGTTHDLAIYGHGWTPELANPRFVKGHGIPNDELARYYSSAAIVLNDHWDDMRAEGFLSNRLYDALACGAFVISDHVEGMEEEFDGAIKSYEGRDRLEAIVERFLADPAERRRLAEHGRRLVLERHTFDERVRVLCSTADQLVNARPDRIVAAEVT